MGSWVSYGLGSENENLPAFVVMISQAHALNTDQPLFSRLWGSGFLPSNYQGVKFRASADPVLFLSDPEGISKQNRRSMLDAIGKLNTIKLQTQGDPEIETRISQYEMAYRMQTSVPELVDLSKEPDSVFEMYGPESRKPGSYARNCLLARRLAERGVRFIQLYHRGWDQHNDLPRDLALQCRGTDQPTAALVRDLKQRGLLDDTLVVWAGNSDAPFTARAASPTSTTAAITTRATSRCGSPAAASSPAWCWAKPTTSATTSRPIPCTSTICRRRSCAASASITRSSRSSFRAAISA